MCTFAALPALTRACDRLSSTDNPTAFKVSKNLERPHEKVTRAPIVRATAAASAVPDDRPAGPAFTPFLPAAGASPVSTPLDRAPPAR